MTFETEENTAGVKRNVSDGDWLVEATRFKSIESILLSDLESIYVAIESESGGFENVWGKNPGTMDWSWSALAKQSSAIAIEKK